MRAGRALASAVFLSFAAAVPFAPRADGLPARRAALPGNCSSLHIIVARGSYEAPGEGCIGTVANAICDEISGCNSAGIVYPATMYATYVTSESKGTDAMLEAAKAYHYGCRHTPIVLMGYSQGAQVVGDAVCGHSEPGWTDTNAINGTVTNRIIAVIQMGDPSFVVGQPYNVGTSTKNGTVKRKDPAACDPFADRIQSYCDAGDPYCASGDNMSVHHGYMPEYKAAAASFVVAKYTSYVASLAEKAALKHHATTVSSVSTAAAATVTPS